MSETFVVSCPHAVLTARALATGCPVQPVSVELQVRRNSTDVEAKPRQIEERLDLFRLSRTRRLVESPAIWTIVDVTHMAAMFWDLASPAMAVNVREPDGQMPGIEFMGGILVDVDSMLKVVLSNRLRSSCLDEYMEIMFETGVVLDDLISWALTSGVEINLHLLQCCVSDGLVSLTPAVAQLGIVDVEAWQIKRVERGLAVEQLKSRLHTLLAALSRDDEFMLTGNISDMISDVAERFVAGASWYLPDMDMDTWALSAMNIVFSTICQEVHEDCCCEVWRDWLATRGADLMQVPQRPMLKEELLMAASKAWCD